MKKHLFFFFVASFMLFSCQKMQSQYSSVEPSAFADKIAKTSKAQIIDVRTPQEFGAEHIKNAKNINWNDSQFEQQIKKLDKSKPVFLYCKSGGRSKKAAQKLEQLGFVSIYELNGGFLKWCLDGFQN